MTSTLLLVATGNIDHGGSVESCTRAGTDTDADTGAANRLRGARVTTNGSAITSRCRGGGSRVLLIGSGTIKTRAGLDGQAGVDHRHQSANGRSGVAV